MTGRRIDMNQKLMAIISTLFIGVCAFFYFFMPTPESFGLSESLKHTYQSLTFEQSIVSRLYPVEDEKLSQLWQRYDDKFMAFKQLAPQVAATIKIQASSLLTAAELNLLASFERDEFNWSFFEKDYHSGERFKSKWLRTTEIDADSPVKLIISELESDKNVFLKRNPQLVTTSFNIQKNRLFLASRSSVEGEPTKRAVGIVLSQNKILWLDLNWRGPREELFILYQFSEHGFDRYNITIELDETKTKILRFESLLTSFDRVLE